MPAPDDSPDSATTIDEEALLQLALAAAAEAAAVLVDGLGRVRTSVATKSSSTDMVTEMDREAELLIERRISSERPDDAVLGEEGTARTGTSGVQWVVDPLDGTTNYLYGHAGFAVSIAARVDGRVVAGVVHDPLHGEVFSARAGHGAFRNGERIAVSGAGELAHALVATGFSYEPDRRERQARVLTTVLPAVRDIRRMGAAAVDLCSVACGRVDAFYERGLQPWDHAAGALVAAEAGALVGDLQGGPASGEFCLAAGPELFEPLATLLRSAGAAHA